MPATDTDIPRGGRERQTDFGDPPKIKKTLGREHLSRFVVTEIGGSDKQTTWRWHVDAALRRQMEKTRLGRRVLCTDQHLWSTGRIVHAFRGQWNVEELFRRAKRCCGACGQSKNAASNAIYCEESNTVQKLYPARLSPWPCWPSKIMKTRGDSRLAPKLRQNYRRRTRW